MELTLPRKLYLLFCVAALVGLFFLIFPKFDDNTLSDFSYEKSEQGMIITGHDGSNKKLEIPDEIDGLPVVEISSHAFANKEKLQSITIPGSVKIIGDYAFDNCKSLKKVVLHKGTEKIGMSAFYGCKNLKEINIPEGLSEIDDFAFYMCIDLEKIKIPASCETIGTDAFSACESLVMDCSENEAARELAEKFKIPTSYKESDSYLMTKVIAACSVSCVLVIAAVILLPKILRKKAQNSK